VEQKVPTPTSEPIARSERNKRLKRLLLELQTEIEAMEPEKAGVPGAVEPRAD
jgi:hypothetical protein